MSNDLYIYFSTIIFILLGGILAFFWFKRFETALFFFGLSPLVSTIFFQNVIETESISTEATIGTGGYLRAILLISLGIVGISKYFRNYSKFEGKIPLQFFFFGIFILFSFFSVYYSLDQRFSLIRVTLLFSVFGFLIGFYSWLQEDGNLKKALNTLFILVSIIVVVTVLSILVVPSRVWWWKADRLIGFWEHPNSFGAFCMLVYPILMWKYYNIKKSNKFIVLIPGLITILLHILSGSRTTLLTSFIGIVIWILLEKNWIKLFFSTIILGLTVVILIEFSPTSFTRQGDSKITDLSSREDIWTSALVFVKENPLLGYGYGVEGKIFQDESKLDLGTTFIERNVRQSMHNGYLSIIVGVGILGLLFWLLVLLYPLFQGFQMPYNTFKTYALVSMIMVLITNFVESALTGYSAATDIFFWISWVISGNILLGNNKLNSNYN